MVFKKDVGHLISTIIQFIHCYFQELVEVIKELGYNIEHTL